jgi:phage-related protein
MHNLPPVYYIIFTAVTAISVLLQACVLLGMFIAMRKAISKLHTTIDEVSSKALPAIASAKGLIEDVSPKLKVAVANLTEVSHTLRQQANHLNVTVESLLDKTNSQVTRVDAMVSAAFDAVDRASRAVEDAVTTPARRFSGIFQGLKTGVEVFLSKKATPQENGTAAAESSEKKPA